MKILALFRDNKDDGKDKENGPAGIGTEIKDIKKWDFTGNIIQSIINMFVSDFDKKTILILPQYVNSMDMGKGFEIYYDTLEDMGNKDKNYENKRLNMVTTEDCLVKIAGKIVPFDWGKTLKDVKKEVTGGGTVLNRQKIISDVLLYTLNQYVVDALTKWALEYQVNESSGKDKKSEEGKTKKEPDDGNKKKENEEKKKDEEKKDEKEEMGLSIEEKPLYEMQRKSLLLVLFKETGMDDKMSDAEKAKKKEEEKVSTPGTDDMDIGDYLENMLGTKYYIPIRYMFFPEVELSSYKEASTSEEKADGDFILVVKRPGDSEYPVIMSDPASDMFDMAKEMISGIFDGISDVFDGKGGSVGNAAKSST